MNVYKIFILLSIFFINNSCNKNHSFPKRVYMPDMYYSKAYETYSDPNNTSAKNNSVPLFKNGYTALHPVKGTISKNYNYNLLKFNIKNNISYENSKKIIKSPLNNNNKIYNLERGKNMYTINCLICHGPNGHGDGKLVKNDKILGVPDYKDRDITIGSIYNVVTYGINNMGSYSSQLNELDRWRVSEYVIFLSKKNK